MSVYLKSIKEMLTKKRQDPSIEIADGVIEGATSQSLQLAGVIDKVQRRIARMERDLVTARMEKQQVVDKKETLDRIIEELLVFKA